MYVMVYCHKTDKRKRNILTLAPNYTSNGYMLSEARERVKISPSKKYRYFPSERYLAFVSKFQKKRPQETIIG